MIERTFDYRKIKKMAPWPPVISSKIIYLIEEDCGLWTFNEHLDGLMIHVEMSLNHRGKESIGKGKEALMWIFNNTETEKIYAVISKDNRPACHNAVHAGLEFTHEDENKRYYEVSKCGN